MREDVVERSGEIRPRGAAGRHRRAVQQRLRTGVMESLEGLHRLKPVERRLMEGRRAPEGPSREHVSECLDRTLVVGRQRDAGTVDPHRAVRLEQLEADREQLHELARIVLVGPDVARTIGFLVAEHAEVIAHLG
jgi:hypothetical protein